MNNFDIKECSGILNKEQLELLLEILPINFYTVEKNVEPKEAYKHQEKGQINVYHDCEIVSFYPPKGKRLANA